MEAVDGVRDNRPQVQVESQQAPAGNDVVLDLGNGGYSLLAHFQKGSVRARIGDRVQAGAILGLTGNSGNSSEPRLHLHVQDRQALFGSRAGCEPSVDAVGVASTRECRDRATLDEDALLRLLVGGRSGCGDGNRAEDADND